MSENNTIEHRQNRCLEICIQCVQRTRSILIGHSPKFFTGKMDELFPGQESSYLRAEIPQISAGTKLRPQDVCSPGGKMRYLG